MKAFTGMSKFNFSIITTGLSLSVIGIIFSMFAVYHCGFNYPDTDRLLTYSLVGGLTFFVGTIFLLISFLRNNQEQLKIIVDNLEEHIQDHLYGDKE